MTASFRHAAWTVAVVLTASVGCSRDASGSGEPSARAVPSATAPRAEATLPVKLDRNGVVQFGSARLLLDDDIGNAFRAFHERAPRGKLVIAAHRATLHGRLVRIVDLAKEANVPFEITIED